MKLLRTMTVPRDIRSPSDIVAGDVAVFAHYPVTIDAGDEVAVYTDFSIYRQDVNARWLLPQIKAVLEGEGGYKVKAYHVGADLMSPGSIMYVLRTKEAVSA